MSSIFEQINSGDVLHLARELFRYINHVWQVNISIISPSSHVVL